MVKTESKQISETCEQFAYPGEYDLKFDDIIIGKISDVKVWVEKGSREEAMGLVSITQASTKMIADVSIKNPLQLRRALAQSFYTGTGQGYFAVNDLRPRSFFYLSSDSLTSVLRDSVLPTRWLFVAAS